MNIEEEIKIKTIEEAKYKLSSRRVIRKAERLLLKEFNNKSISIPYGKTFSKKASPISKAMRLLFLRIILI